MYLQDGGRRDLLVLVLPGLFQLVGLPGLVLGLPPGLLLGLLLLALGHLGLGGFVPGQF